MKSTVNNLDNYGYMPLHHSKKEIKIENQIKENK